MSAGSETSKKHAGATDGRELSLQEALQLAVRLHQGGRLAEAETLYREIRSQLQAAQSSLHIQQRQIALYRKRLVPQSHSHAELSLRAYENNRVEFNSVVLARIAELDTRLKALRLQVDRASTLTKLAYLSGETK